MLLFCDSFQHSLTAQLGAKWSNVVAAAIDPTAGRRGGGALDLSQPLRAISKLLTPATTHEFVMGLAVKLVRCDVPFNLFGVAHLNGLPQLSVAVNRDRSVYVAAGGSYAGAAGTRLSPDSQILLPADDFYYVELAGLLSTTFGVFNLRINGVTVLEDINVSTSPADPDETWALVYVNSGSAGRAYVCDLYVLDTSTAYNNAPLGDVRVDTRFAIGPCQFPTTAHDAWFSILGSDKNGGAYLALDEVTPNTTDFVIGSCGYQGSGLAGGQGFPEVDAIQLVAVQSAPAPADPIYGVQLCSYAAKSAAAVGNTLKLQHVARQHTVIFQQNSILLGTPAVLASAYGYVLTPLDTNPFTFAPWTAKEFQESDFGVYRADQQAGVFPTVAAAHSVTGAPTISGLSQPKGTRCGGGEITVTGTNLPIPLNATSIYRLYLRIASGDIPMVPAPTEVGTPGTNAASVKVLVPGGRYRNEAALSLFAGAMSIVAKNPTGEVTTAFELELETAGLAQFLVETIQPQVPITIAAGDVDFLGACAQPSTDLANIALSHIGVNKQIESVLLDETAEAIQVRLHYARTTNAVLRDFSWPFATRYATLVLEEGTADVPVNGDWQYSYRAPLDLVAARRIVREGMKRTPDPTPPSYRMGSDLDGAILFTDVIDPELEYTGRTTCPALYGDALFQEALAWRLAHALAPALAKDSKAVGLCWAMYQDVLSRARAVSANEGQAGPSQVDPDWLTGR